MRETDNIEKKALSSYYKRKFKKTEPGRDCTPDTKVVGSKACLLKRQGGNDGRGDNR